MSETNKDVNHVNIFDTKQKLKVLLERTVVRSMKDRIFFNFKYRTLFRCNNYLGIISGSEWKKMGIILDWGSFPGRDHFRDCTEPGTGYLSL